MGSTVLLDHSSGTKAGDFPGLGGLFPKLLNLGQRKHGRVHLLISMDQAMDSVSAPDGKRGQAPSPPLSHSKPSNQTSQIVPPPFQQNKFIPKWYQQSGRRSVLRSKRNLNR